MQLYCPTCRRARPLGLRCPECDGRLVAAGEAHDAKLTGHAAHLPPPPAPSLAGRIIVGVVAALGTVVALRDLALGFVGLLWGSESAAAVAPALDVSFATIGAMAGGLLAGAGLPRGTVAGGFAGACVGILLTSLAAHAGDRPPLTASDLAVAVGLTVVAAIAGRVGTRVWPPALPLPKPENRNRSSSVARLVEDAAAETLVSPPTQWWRIALAAVVFVFGIWHAEGLRVTATNTIVPLVNVTKVAHSPDAAGLLAVVAATLAGVVAGAVTHSGWRHGLYAGLAGAGVVTLLLSTGDAAIAAAVESLQALIRVPLPGGLFAIIIVLAAITTAGGAFGAALMPVLGKTKRTRRMMD